MTKILTIKTILTRQEYAINLVLDNDLKCCGRGEFAEVFAKKTGKTVTKICKGRDEAYITYVRYILKYQSNPWFPKIKTATLFVPKSEDYGTYFVVEMEKLRPAHGKEAARILCILDDGLDFMAPILDSLPHSTAADHMRVAAVTLKRLFKKYGPDMRSANIMFRGMQPVIIDPAVDGNAFMLVA